MIISKKSIYSKFCSFFRLNTAPLSILFFGSDIISKELLAPLHQNLTLPSTSPLKLLTNLEVVTHHKTALRGFYPIHSFCDQYGIPYNSPLTSKSKGDHSLEWDNFLTNKVSKAQGFDLGIVCSFGYMIPDKLIEYCKEGIIIVHPSLLPKYRGAAPIYHALLNGDKVSGVSFIDISSNKFDAGQILTQISLEISEKWKYNDLALGLGKLAGHNVLDVIKNLKELRNKALPQNEKGKSSARKIKPEETFVNWEKDKPENIKQKFRAFSGSNMNALKTIFQTKVVFFVDIEAVLQKDEEELLNNYKKTNCGGIFLIKDKRFKKFLYVKCKDGWVKVMKWRFHDQGVKESHVFISQFMNKDKVYEGEDSYSPYSFTSQ